VAQRPGQPGPLPLLLAVDPIPHMRCHITLMLRVQPGYCYSKSSVFTPDDSLLPHLELEMGVRAGQEQLLLCVNMDPRLSLVRAA